MPTNENKFKIGLTNVDFDNTYSNVLHFDSRQQQEEYFSTNTLFVNKPLVNLPIGNYYMQRVVINLAENTDYTDLMNFNYCIIEDTTQNAKIHYWYYFVNKPQYTADKQIICDLELDIFNTYYLDISFQDCLIRKAHLNRFINDDETGYVKFDCGTDSKLFVQEDIKPQAKYLRNRQEFSLCSYQDNSLLSYVVNNKLISWVYVYVELNQTTGKFLNIGYNDNNNWIIDQNYQLDEINYNTELTKPYIVLCYPTIFDPTNSYDIHLNVKYQTQNGSVTEELKFDANNWASVFDKLAPFVINVNISAVSPFESLDNSNNDFIVQSYVQDEIEHISITYSNKNINNIFGCVVGMTEPIGQSNYGALYLLKTRFNNTNNYKNFDIPYTDVKFSKSNIINSTHNKNYNPKLLSETYRELRIGYGNGQPHIYDIQKINNNEFKLKWNTSLDTGIIRVYMGIEGGIYNYYSYRAMVGALISQDTTMPFTIDQLSQYLAQNKNFYLQRDVSNIGNLSKNIIGSLAHNKTPIGMTGDVVNNIIDVSQKYINSDLSLDNMSNAPNIFKNIDGSPLLNLGLNGIAPYMELWLCLPSELKIADDYMNMFGYNYNQIDNIKNVDNIRHYFNFIQAEVENIFSNNVNLSNMVREKFIDVFRKGVRFWNITDLVTQKTYSFTQHENYENWLEE